MLLACCRRSRERQIAVLPILDNPELAEVNMKVLDSEQLSKAEQGQWDVYLSAQVDIIERGFGKP